MNSTFFSTICHWAKWNMVGMLIYYNATVTDKSKISLQSPRLESLKSWLIPPLVHDGHPVAGLPNPCAPKNFYACVLCSANVKSAILNIHSILRRIQCTISFQFFVWLKPSAEHLRLFYLFNLTKIATFDIFLKWIWLWIDYFNYPGPEEKYFYGEIRL